MPAHPRRQVRDAVIALLNSHVPSSLLPAGHVLGAQPTVLASLSLPAILVYVSQETSTRADQGGGRRRFLDLCLDLRVPVDSDLDNRLDDLALEAEASLDASGNLGGLAVDLLLVKTEIGLLNDNDNVAVNGFARLTWRVQLQDS